MCFVKQHLTRSQAVRVKLSTITMLVWYPFGWMNLRTFTTVLIQVDIYSQTHQIKKKTIAFWVCNDTIYTRELFFCRCSKNKIHAKLNFWILLSMYTSLFIWSYPHSLSISIIVVSILLSISIHFACNSMYEKYIMFWLGDGIIKHFLSNGHASWFSNKF